MSKVKYLVNKPLLNAVGANENDLLTTKLSDNSNIDTFINENGEIVCKGPYSVSK